MRIGAVVPQTEIGADVGGVRAWAEAVASLGFAHVLAYDHVVGADPAVREGFKGYYDVHSTFHEPFVLYGYLAALTDLELVTGILILPQRQTALVAKQAAEVDLLSGGRLRLGVGIGWNAVEYEVLGQAFGDRGKRITEQVAILRALWSEETVNFSGEYEQVVGVGIAPLPVQRPIPVWFGANVPAALARAGSVADGWFPQRRPGAGFEEDVEIVYTAARAAGRDPSSLGMEGRVSVNPDDRDETQAQVAAWRGVGATHCSINTMSKGFTTVDQHIEALTAFASDAALHR